MEIFRSCAQGRVTKDLLHKADIHTVIQTMRCATMAQDVRVNALDAGAFSRRDDDAIDALFPQGFRARLSLRQFMLATKKMIERFPRTLPVGQFKISKSNALQFSTFAPLAPPIAILAPGDAAALVARMLQEKTP